MPDQNNALLTPATASYTVMVDTTPATPFKDLTIQNAVGNTTTLDIDAAGFTSTNGLITLDRGAVVNVNGGGEMRYGGWPGGLPCMTIKNGGLLHIDGGAFNFTNLPSPGTTSYRHIVYVGHQSAGRLEIDSGEFNLIAAPGNEWAVMYIGFGVGSDGYMIMRGGTFTLIKAQTLDCLLATQRPVTVNSF